MRPVIKPHRELGDIDIAGIDLGRTCHDDMPGLLTGLQHLYCDMELRSKWLNNWMEENAFDRWIQLPET